MTAARETSNAHQTRICIRNIKTRDVKLMLIAKNVNKMGTEPNAAKNLYVDLSNGVRNGEAKKLDEK